MSNGETAGQATLDFDARSLAQDNPTYKANGITITHANVGVDGDAFDRLLVRTEKVYLTLLTQVPHSNLKEATRMR